MAAAGSFQGARRRASCSRRGRGGRCARRSPRTTRRPFESRSSTCTSPALTSTAVAPAPPKPPSGVTAIGSSTPTASDRGDFVPHSYEHAGLLSPGARSATEWRLPAPSACGRRAATASAQCTARSRRSAGPCGRLVGRQRHRRGGDARHGGDTRRVAQRPVCAGDARDVVAGRQQPDDQLDRVGVEVGECLWRSAGCSFVDMPRYWAICSEFSPAVSSSAASVSRICVPKFSSAEADLTACDGAAFRVRSSARCCEMAGVKRSLPQSSRGQTFSAQQHLLPGLTRRHPSCPSSTAPPASPPPPASAPPGRTRRCCRRR